MEVQKYIARMKLFYSTFLTYIKGDIDTPESFQELVGFIKINQYVQNSSEFRSIIHIIYKISSHYKRTPLILSKFEKIILYFEKEIKQTLSNQEIFNIFKNDKLLLLFLFEKKIITINESIASLVIDKYGYFNSSFFYPELKPFFPFLIASGKNIISDDPTDAEGNFEKMRHEGINESRICQIIRNDSLDEFISYVSEEKIDLSSDIPESFYETNAYLIKNLPSLIDYAAFCGSFRIFHHLLQTEDETPTLWVSAVHGRNFDILNLLKENGIEPEFNSYNQCLLYAIKCHHNDIVRFIENNFNLNKEDYDDENYIYNYFCCYNFEFFPDDFNDKYELFFEYACIYDYTAIVESFIKDGKINLREFLISKSILTFILFLNKISKKIFINEIQHLDFKQSFIIKNIIYFVILIYY